MEWLEKKAIIAALNNSESKPYHLLLPHKICLLLLLMSIGILLVMFFRYPILGIFLLGVMFVHAVELQHEILHKTGNAQLFLRCIGFVLGLPMLVSFSHYQYNHMRHHRFLGTKYDSEFFDYGNKKSHQMSKIKLLINILMIAHYISIGKNIMKSICGKTLAIESKNVAKKVRYEYLLQGLIIVFAIIISIKFHSSLILNLWLLPLLIAIPIHVLVELPEHFGCNRNSVDIFENTRTITAGRFMTWLVNGNNFHVEHHYAATVPIHQLKELHHIIQNKIHFKSHSYYDFYLMLFKNLFRFKITATDKEVTGA